MRGIISFGILIFGLITVMMVAPAIEDVSSYVTDNDAVQSSGNDDTVTDIKVAILRYGVLVALAVGVVASVVWYLRRERRVARRPPR